MGKRQKLTKRERGNMARNREMLSDEPVETINGGSALLGLTPCSRAVRCG